MATARASPNSAVGASCTAQEWEIRNLSILKKKLKLPQFVVEDKSWYLVLRPCNASKIPDVSLRCVDVGSSALRVRFSVTYVNRKDPEKCAFRGEAIKPGRRHEDLDRIFKAGKSCAWGFKSPFQEKSTPCGLILGDRLVLRTRVRVSQDTSPGSVDGPLLEESVESLTQACLRAYKGRSTSEPDVTLKLGDTMLPAHRALLAESSDVLKAMFQSGMSESRSQVVEIQEIAAEDMEVILKFMYGALDAIPEERLPSLVLATDRLQVNRLTERCITQLMRRLTLDILVDTAVLADRVKHQRLLDACVEFALQEENRLILGKHKALKRAMADAPEFAFKLLGDVLEQSVPKKARRE